MKSALACLMASPTAGVTGATFQYLEPRTEWKVGRRTCQDHLAEYVACLLSNGL